MLNNGNDDLEKYDPQNDEFVFVGYSSSSVAYVVFNKRTLCIEECFHVIIYEGCELTNLVQKNDDELV